MSLERALSRRSRRSVRGRRPAWPDRDCLVPLEEELRTVGRPTWLEGVVEDLPLPRPVRGDGPDIGGGASGPRCRSATGEVPDHVGEPPAVRRPLGPELPVAATGQPSLPAPVDVHHPDRPLLRLGSHVGDPTPIRRQASSDSNAAVRVRFCRPRPSTPTTKISPRGTGGRAASLPPANGTSRASTATSPRICPKGRAGT